MAQDFKTTFIPKAPVETPQQSTAANRVKVRHTVSILTVIATLVFLVALVSIAGVFVYERSLTSRIAHMENQLETAEKQFEPALITTLKELDERLELASGVVRQHRSLAPFFSLLNSTSLKSVQYDQFNFDFTEEGVGLVQIEGRARSYQAIAQQSEKFAETRLIQDHIFSDFVLQDTGRVRFSLLITLSPDILLFENSIQTVAQPVASTPTTTGLPVVQ